MSAKAPAKGHTVKHTKTSKASKASAKHRPNHHKKPATSKAPGHKVTAKAKHPAHAKAVGFAVGDALPVCSFEAVAQSLRLLGQPVHDDEVAQLWHLLGEPDEGVPVGEALAAAALFGLGGYRPAFAVRRQSLNDMSPVGLVEPVDQFTGFIGVCRPNEIHSLILHVDVPGPHAVLATRDGWWSWGELYDPWACNVTEAWAVSWS